MPVILQQLVTTLDGFKSRKAVIELHDDGRFVMFRIDQRSQVRTETLMEVPVSSLEVRGHQSYLIFRSGGIKWRVDFKNPNQLTGFAAAGVVGVAIANAYLNPSGIRAWVDALRANGARVKYSGMSTSMKILLIIFGLIFALIILFPVLSPLIA